MSIRTGRIRTGRIRGGGGQAALAVTLAAFLLSCSTAETDGGAGAGTRPSTADAAAAVPDAPEVPATSAAPEATSAEAPPTPGPVKVRDAFAGLQATLDDTCTPGAGDCAYFLGRVHEELAERDAAMKADPKGPGHFPEPIAWIGGLRETLGGDTSTGNLEKHRSELIGVRDKINTWMQDHPDDYR